MMSTPWEDDVAEAMRCALSGTSENWPATARVLHAEISELRAELASGKVLPPCACKPGLCLGEGDSTRGEPTCEHCATIDGELPCPIADAEPVRPCPLEVTPGG